MSKKLFPTELSPLNGRGPFGLVFATLALALGRGGILPRSGLYPQEDDRRRFEIIAFSGACKPAFRIRCWGSKTRAPL